MKELADSIHFEGGFDELIERLPLYDILLMPGMTQRKSMKHLVIQRNHWKNIDQYA